VLQLIDSLNIDNPFQYTKDKNVDPCMYQLPDHMKGIWYNTIRKATVQDPLHHLTVQDTCDGNDESRWQIHGQILYQSGKGDVDSIYISPTAHSNRLNIRDEIMRLTHQELVHLGPNKCYQYDKVYFIWYSLHQDFVDFCCRCYLYQVNKRPTQVLRASQDLCQF
jgi:hypothetical protein